MADFINGGMLAGKKKYVMSAVGILSAIATYLVGDSDVFIMLQTIFVLGGIYILRKPSETKG